MKLKSIIIVFITSLIILFTGCINSEGNKTINPFDDIPINSTKRIEFSNLMITSNEKESGRSKIITNAHDIQDIVKYLKTISCVESSQRRRNPDFIVSFIDNTEKEKSYVYSIGVSKNQMYIDKCSSNETNIFVYKCKNANIIEELSKLYNNMNYLEELLMKK